MIDQTLSDLSDLAFEGAMAGYLVALVCHVVKTAAHRAPRAAQSVAAQSVAASASATPHVPASRPELSAGPSLPPTAPGSTGPSMIERVGRAAVIVTAVGFCLHVAALVLRGLSVQRGPWANMYEFALVVTGAAVAGWLIALWKNHAARAMGIYVMTPIAVLVFLDGTVLYTRSAPVVPILNSYWLNVHVTAISLSSGVLLFSGLASLAYLARLRYDNRALTGALAGRRAVTRLPTADTLDRIAYRVAIIAFPFYTFAIIAGALWAEVAWGSYWSWDPKETVSLATWIVYAGYLHARATAGWRGKPAAWIAVAGLVTIIFNLFFVNLVISGLHSYAGLN